LSRYYSSYQNADGTISDENIGKFKEHMGKLKFQYEKRYPNSMEIIGLTDNMFGERLDQMGKDNTLYRSMNFEMNKLMGEDEGSIGSLINKYSAYTSKDVLENRDTLINELSEVTSKIGNYSKKFDDRDLKLRSGSSSLIDNMSKGKNIIKSLQQQLLDIDSKSADKIITKKERLAFDQYIKNDNISLLEEIISENQQGIKNKKKAAVNSIEQSVKNYAEAEGILSLEANKHYLKEGGELSDSKGNPSGFTATEWIQKQNDAYTELKTGNLDEKLRNLYASGTGYMDLYSDREVGKYISKSKTLGGLFGVEEGKAPITPIGTQANLSQTFVKAPPPKPGLIGPPLGPTPDPKAEKVDINIQEFLDIPIQKYTSNAPSKEEIGKWKNKFKEKSNWPDRSIDKAVTLLKSIYRDNIKLNKLPEWKAKRKEDLQKTINRKTMEFQAWTQSPDFLEMLKPEPFTERIKDMPVEQLKSQASLQLKGDKDSSWNNSIRAAREELKRRSNTK
jgi:hypothetical protein